MSAPQRWQDSEDSPENVRRLFSAGRPTHAMTDRTRARLSRRIGLVASVPMAATLLTWKGLAIAATLGLATAVTVAEVIHLRAQPAVHQPLPLPAAVPLGRGAPPAPSADMQPGRDLAQPAAQPPPPSPPSPPPPIEVKAPTTRAQTTPLTLDQDPSAPSPVDDTLSREVALLERAGALSRPDGEAALAVLNEHVRRFPNGKLRVERELLALDTLERLGRRAEARARAAELLISARGTIYEARVQSHLSDGAP